MADRKVLKGKRKIQKVEMTDKYLRLRYENPNKFTKGSLRVVDVGKAGHTKIIVGRFPKQKTTKLQAVLIDRNDLPRMVDTDKDGVPDEYDCNPTNPDEHGKFGDFFKKAHEKVEEFKEKRHKKEIEALKEKVKREEKEAKQETERVKQLRKIEDVKIKRSEQKLALEKKIEKARKKEDEAEALQREVAPTFVQKVGKKAVVVGRGARKLGKFAIEELKDDK